MSESPEPLERKLDVGVDDGGDCLVEIGFRNVQFEGIAEAWLQHDDWTLLRQPILGLK